MSLPAAISSSLAGDHYWLLEGTYNGSFNMNRSGTAQNPILFRAYPGAHVLINGGINVTGAYNWIWGLEITDPNYTSTIGSGISLAAAGTRAINNVVHHMYNQNGIWGVNAGPGQIIYGNVVYENGQGIYHPHNIYTQNTYSSYGYKRIINNMFLDSDSVCSGCFNFHAYTEGGYITGFHIEKNVFKNGRFLIGGYNVPADNEVVRQNYYYQSRVQFGYARPAQAEFTGNYLGRTTLAVQWFWGDGEVQYPQTAPNVFTGNTILLPPGAHVDFRTSAYLSTGRCEGCPAIQSTDAFNGNTYSTPFQASFFANNTNLGIVNLSGWKSATTSAGKGFDASSVEVPAPTAPHVVVLPNDYDPGRAHLVIYNWGLANNVSVDLSSVVAQGSSYEVHDAKSLYGAPVKSGTYNGPVSVPMGGAEFGSFVVLAGAGQPANNTPPSVSITFPADGSVYVAPATIAIDATASDSDGSVTRVDFYAGSTLIGSDTSSPYSVTWNNVSTGNYALTARAIDNDGAQSTSTAVDVAVGAAQASGHQDIGNVGIPGDATKIGGTLTVRGSGANIGGRKDGLHYAFETLSGDGEIVARVTGIDNTHAKAKAGVLIRENLAADSKNVAMLISAGNKALFQRRSEAGIRAETTKVREIAAPYWVKLSRSGANFTASISTNGIQWTTVGTASISMTSTVYVGTGVSSHDNTVLCSATFEQVQVVP